MRRPAQHFASVDPGFLEALGPDALRIRVPRLSLLSLWVEPALDLVLSHEAGRSRAVLAARACSLNGSDLVRRLRLEERFELDFVMQLDWGPGEEDAGGAAGPGGGAAAAAATAGTTPTPLRGALQIGVAAEVVPPFNLLPRSALEAACNGALRASVAALLPRFLGQLGEDYERWGAIEEHRAGLVAAQERGARAGAARAKGWRRRGCGGELPRPARPGLGAGARGEVASALSAPHCVNCSRGSCCWGVG
jgi:hypothetical protein